MHTSAVLARWDCLTCPLYHSGFTARSDVNRGTGERPPGPRASDS